MELKRIRRTAAKVLVTPEWEILISYSTPVAAYNRKNGRYYRTEEKFSSTTSRHINSWLPSKNTPAEAQPQEFFDSLVGK